MTIQVRTIDRSELSGWIAAKDVAFLHPRRDSEAVAEFLAENVDFDRTWASLDLDAIGSPIVGTLKSIRSRLTVPGPREVTASALTAVTVLPTHRRRGLLTEMISGELTASVARGEAVAILIAAEYPIYGRFGFGHAVDSASYAVDTRGVRFREKSGGATESVEVADSPGRTEIVDYQTLGKEAPPVFERFRKSQHGSIDRNDFWWRRSLQLVEVPEEEPLKGLCAIYRSPAGDVEGYVRYRTTGLVDAMRPVGVVDIDELVSVTPDAYRGLWKLCCDIDLVSTVNASDRTVDEPLPWLLEDGRAVRQSSRFDFLWVRVLDVPSALSARTYELADQLVFEVDDPFGFTGGRFALDAGPEGATCRPTNSAADLALPVDVLGSVYLGGVSLSILAASGRVDEIRDGAVSRADRLFRTRTAPWCSTWF